MNRQVMRAALEHHGVLAAQLSGRTDAVVDAARRGGGDRQRDGLCRWYRTELIPHIVAEEHVLYAAGRSLEATCLLVAGMTEEHRALVSLVARLGVASSTVEIAAAASSAREVFALHVAKEDDLLLPALDRAQLDLGRMLVGMHEILGPVKEQQIA
ncbi:hemerythrin domain-containing protein [Leekyejoonella antrihumi]|uniref:Hemerythrin-like domain-containing protein n=1 Tax=Leekyejoonella antrihumi TaxID=1660198 RepID=A0A563E2B5_9MICO|nr:hemerythrin domain-containing protein [Leekyejoonella antrihumi]TWP36677.1 hypothetical protein FGL98_09485 [Leekyejoonella antrihumi]